MFRTLRLFLIYNGTLLWPVRPKMLGPKKWKTCYILYILTHCIYYFYGQTFQGLTKIRMFPCKYDMWPYSRASIFKRVNLKRPWFQGVACSADIPSIVQCDVTSLSRLFYDTFRDATSFCDWRCVVYLQADVASFIVSCSRQCGAYINSLCFSAAPMSFTGIQSFSSAELDKAFPWRDIRFHVTITYWTSLFTSLPSPPPIPLDKGPHWTGTHPYLLLISSGHLWRPVQTCSLQETPLPHPQLVLTSAGTYGRHQRSVRILLECFLVNWNALNFSLTLNYSRTVRTSEEHFFSLQNKHKTRGGGLFIKVANSKSRISNFSFQKCLE